MAVSALVLILKISSYKLNSIFSLKKPKFLESGVTEPTWVRLRNSLCAEENTPENQTDLKPGPSTSADKPAEPRPRIMEETGWIPENAARIYEEIHRQMMENGEIDDITNGRQSCKILQKIF